MTGDQLKKILERLDVSRSSIELITFKGHYAHDVPILLSEIERLHKIIDSMKEEDA